MAIKITSKTNRIIDRDKKVMLTTTREVYPFVAERGEGDFVYDHEGNRFVDFSSFISVYNLGVNSNAAVRKAIKDQVDRLMHAAFTDFYGERPVRFAEKIMTMMPPGFGRAFYSNSGTEANEAAIKFAKIFTKRPYIISFYNSFHGRTGGSLGLTASRTIQKEHFGPFTGVVHAPFPYPYRPLFGNGGKDCSDAYIGYIEDYILSKEVPPQETAAIFIEPIQGEGGYIVPPKGFMQKLRKLASKHGILLVSDEIQAGYMRTGKFLGMSNFGVKADIYSMAKALGAGLPIGMTITRKSLGDIPGGSHSNTFGGNLVAIAAAEASLDYVKKNRKALETGIRKKGAHVMKRLKEMRDAFEIVGDVRGIGLMIGMEFVKDKKSKAYGTREQEEVLTKCFNNGLLLMPCGRSSMRIIPPLTMRQDHLDKGLDILEKAIKETSANK